MNTLKKMKLLILPLLVFVSSAEANIAVGSVARVLPTHSSAGGLIGVVRSFNGVDVQLEVEEVVSTVAPYTQKRTISVSANQLRVTNSLDFLLKSGSHARVTDETSGLALLIGEVAARDGRSAIFMARRRQELKEAIPFRLLETRLTPVRLHSIRPQPGDLIEVSDASHPLKGVRGEVVFQSGREAKFVYLTATGMKNATYIQNNQIKVLLTKIHPDFSIEHLASSFQDLVTVAYGSKRVIYQRLATQLDRIAPATSGFVPNTAGFNARVFALLAIRPILEGAASEIESTYVLGAYRKALGAHVGKGSLNEIAPSPEVFAAAASVLEACVSAMKQVASNDQQRGVDELRKAAGIFLASQKRASDVKQLLVSFDSQDSLFLQLETNVRTQSVMITLRSILEYLAKKV